MTRWVFSADWHSHAVSEHASHPAGLLLAQCGHVLMATAVPREEPLGTPCPECAQRQPAARPCRTRLAVLREELGWLRSMAGLVLALAAEADRLSDPQLRDRLAEMAQHLAHRVAGGAS